MFLRPSVLCPVDFSDASRGALRHAAAIAEHFYAGLTVIAVDDYSTMTAASVFPELSLPPLQRPDVERFVRHALEREPAVPDIDYVVPVARPAAAILSYALEESPDLIVMSTHGRTGLHKVFFGSTTERVLRETSVPVLVTPADDPGPRSLEALKLRLRRVLAPIDLSAATARQVRIGRGLAEAFDAKLLLLHVLTPPPRILGQSDVLQRFRDGQREAIRPQLDQLLAGLPARLHATAEVRCGEPAEEIAGVARDNDAGLVVMGLHSTVGAGPRMGSVTYRVLCRLPKLVLALPPMLDAHQTRSATSLAGAAPLPSPGDRRIEADHDARGTAAERGTVEARAV